MAKGEFTDEEIEMAKKQLSFAIKMSFDNQNSIINNYVFHNLAKVPLLKERQKLIQEVTKADIMKLAKKLKLGLVYELKENGHEEDSSKGLK